MKTESYNPSPLEVEIAQILNNNSDIISNHLKNRKIVFSEVNLNLDNPSVQIVVMDSNGDKHIVILKIIQKPDEE